MKNNRYLSLLAAATLLTVAACAPLGKYTATQTVPDGLYTATNKASENDNIALLSWNQYYTDPQLQSLIQTALDNNADLKIAQEHIAQAQAAVSGAKLAFVPTLHLDANVGTSIVQGQGASDAAFSISANPTWELSIYRKITTLKSNKVTAQMMEDYKQAVQSSLVANVANCYYTLLMLDAQLRIAIETDSVWEKSVRTINALKTEGFADEVAVNQYAATLAGIKATTIDLRRQITIAENNLSLLLNQPCQHIARGTLASQNVPSSLSTGVPMQLLTLRPDVRAAGREIEVAFYTTRNAWLNFFPTITLSGQPGLTNNISGVIVPTTAIANLSAGIIAPILNGGYNRTQLKIAESQQKEVALKFDKTVYNAAMEVNNALCELQSTQQQQPYYEAQVNSLTKARHDTELLMQNSQDKTYLDVLTAHNALFEAQFSLVANRTQQLIAATRLYEALGGGAL